MATLESQWLVDSGILNLYVSYYKVWVLTWRNSGMMAAPDSMCDVVGVIISMRHLNMDLSPHAVHDKAHALQEMLKEEDITQRLRLALGMTSTWGDLTILLSFARRRANVP